MVRFKKKERHAWASKLERIGFHWHTGQDGKPYWREDAYISLSMDEVLRIELAVEELWEMVLEAVDFVIQNPEWLERFGLTPELERLAKKSWEEDAPSIYARFDLAVDGKGSIKMLELNGDTPTSLLEASIAQWNWKEDCFDEEDQFNSLHDKLVAYWGVLKPYIKGILYFGCMKDCYEDASTLEYIRECAAEAGIQTKPIAMEDIRLSTSGKFVDSDGNVIESMFKLYPWEFIQTDEFCANIEASGCTFIEPAWKVIASSKALLPILYMLFPQSPYLLESYFEGEGEINGVFVKKPIFSREGQNVQIVENGSVLEGADGAYSKFPNIIQKYAPLFKDMDTEYSSVVGAWVVGQEPAGIGIRECKGRITGDTSWFIPHVIEG